MEHASKIPVKKRDRDRQQTAESVSSPKKFTPKHLKKSEKTLWSYIKPKLVNA